MLTKGLGADRFARISLSSRGLLNMVFEQFSNGRKISAKGRVPCTTRRRLAVWLRLGHHEPRQCQERDGSLCSPTDVAWTLPAPGRLQEA